MAVIHQTTLTPSKLELVAAWLPGRQWYLGTTPRLRKVGGFRLDDADGAVGIEFLLLMDESGADAVLYSVPLTYRGVPVPGGDGALLGTAEHGVLGRRWIYDGASDPVAVDAVLDLVAGRVSARAQNASDSVDTSVVVSRAELSWAGGEMRGAVDDDAGTDVSVGGIVLRFSRRPVAPAPGVVGSVAAPSASADQGQGLVEVVRVVPG
ncbi:1,4-alpha-glucan branching protein [Nocardia sp. NPDC057663]|uniref:maltokinase N-terminal cap-like domain-containing protein n=1 Tax=Nocardia sp. NPDC057663 TaxID=3346201 RepID=UPI003671B1F3